MSLLAKLQEDMRVSMKARDSIRTNILKLVISDAARLESSPGRKGGALTDAEVHKIIDKLVEGNTETLTKLPAGDSRIAPLEEENRLLKTYLPTKLSEEEVRREIAPLAAQIQAARSDGEATGIVMKHFKTTGGLANGSDVTKIVKEIRATDSNS